jgi:hypothetical protein
MRSTASRGTRSIRENQMTRQESVSELMEVKYRRSHYLSAK